jgi:hypothetical protein
MKFLPWNHYDIQTSLNREKVVELLGSEVEPRKWPRFSFSRQHKKFEGEVTWEGFKIRRIIHYRNSFLPMIHGRFEQVRRGIDIKVRMRLHPVVIAFMCFWFGFLGLGICIIGVSVISGKTEFSPFLLIPFGMVLFGWLLVSGSFWFEAKRAKALLNDIMLQRRQ